MILAMRIAFFAVGCGPEYEDTNAPEDYSLAHITDESIINLDVGASNYTRKPGTEECDDLSRMVEFKSKNFNGVSIVMAGESADFYMSIEVW